MRLKNYQGMDKKLGKHYSREISIETKRRVLEMEKNRISSFSPNYGVEPYSIPGIDLFFGSNNAKQKIKKRI